jgi:3-oxoacyl-[acyl-carrier-protein] synthase III
LKTIIAATGSAFAERQITNDFFLDKVFYDPSGNPIPKPTAEIVQKLEEITGIKERRYVSEKGDSTPLLHAGAKDAIDKWGKDPETIGGIIVAHNAGNMLENMEGFHPVPNMAALLKNKLGIKNHECFAYDILFGCPGWVQGLMQAHQAIQMGDADNILVVGLEVASRVLDPHDLDSMIFGDGCGATILSRADVDSQEGIISYATFSHAHDDVKNIYCAPSVNRDLKVRTLLHMNGKEVYRYATTWVPQVVKNALDKAKWGINEVDMFLFHQANAKMLEAIANNIARLSGIENISFANKIPMIIQFTGNTSVATVPTMLDLIRYGKLQGFEIKKGMKVVFSSVGAGMHCNALAYQF